MKLVTSFRLTSGALAIVSLLIIQSALSGSDSVISGATIQAGWCVQGDYICLVSKYAIGSFLFIALAFRGDLIWNALARRRRRSEQFIEDGKTRAGMLPNAEKYAPADYEIEAHKVLDNPFANQGETLNRIAGVLVESVGEAKIQCVAKLSKIGRVKRNGKQRTYEPINIHDVNPKGYYLRWDGGANGCILTEYRPHRIDFADAYERDGFFRHGNVLFEKDYAKPMPVGIYSIQIDIYQVMSGKQTKIKTVGGLLGILLYFSRSPSPLSGEGIYVKWVEENDLN